MPRGHGETVERTVVPAELVGTMTTFERPGRYVLLAAALGGCLYDASERCGPAMTFDPVLAACVCDSDAVTTGLGCVPCAPDEIVVNGACSCPAGATKNDDNVCEHVAGLGDPCVDGTSCTSDVYAVCAPATAGTAASTCTSACTSNADCGGAYTCATWEPVPYCRPYAGLGKSCGSSADCAGTDAPYCETYQIHSCIVAGCSLETDNCPRDSTCCDFSVYGLGTLCAGACP